MIEGERSVFHAGEREIQRRTGVREQMEIFGRSAIRPFMPDQHREFFAQLPFLVLGSVDEEGWPWASMLVDDNGFVSSPDAKTLRINARAAAGDPLADALRPGAAVGVLGLELGTRRRNRANGHVAAVDSDGFTVNVDQSFGNCPQYIQTRSVYFVRAPDIVSDGARVEHLAELDDAARRTIDAADTFFVASYLNKSDNSAIDGVDISHRGGRPGFVRIKGNTLTVPDYSGNFQFNTLGNLLKNPKAGLIFPDFSTGDMLLLTGSTEILWEDHADVQAFVGAERAWTFTVKRAIRLTDAMPLRAALLEYSPNTLITGTWSDTEAVIDANARRHSWHPYHVAKIEDDSEVIRSFYLQPSDGVIVPFAAGQYLTIRLNVPGHARPLVRTYTVSSAPGDDHYRISVKRESDGVVSSFLHEQLAVGDTLSAKAPQGKFSLDPREQRPAVLLAGGVGITPMVSMAQHAANEALRTRFIRPLTVLHAARDTRQRAFYETLRRLERETRGVIRYASFVDALGDGEVLGHDANGVGSIDAQVLQKVLPLADYDCYLCGPPAFVQSLYDTLRVLGVRDERIFAEEFGPSSLRRKPDSGSPGPASVEEADQAVIKFSHSGFEQRWNAGDPTLLETAEAHGLTPSYGCRNGICGSCAVKLNAGTVAYRVAPSLAVAEGEVLLCCAVPAAGTADIELDL